MTYRHGQVAYTYHCPRHGEFEVLVKFGEDPPEYVHCYIPTPVRYDKMRKGAMTDCFRRSNRVYGVGMIRVIGGTTPTR